MKKAIYILLGLLINQLAIAQCGTDEYNKRLVQDKLKEGQHYLDYLHERENFEYQVEYDAKTKKATRVIPVVFHVVHAYGEENISKEQIEDQMRIINEDFQKKNADTSETRAYFKGRAANMEIEFKLARIAPDGSCTEGITRTYDPVNTIEDYDDNDNEVKAAVTPWDRNKYLNVWVVTTIQSNREGTILGYAQFPSQGAATDGVVVIHDRVGTIGSARAVDAGRTLTHEIGHWLGLYHPFQGGCTNISSRTDQVDDTPPVDEPSYGCTAGQNPNTCNNDFPNEIDNVENFMDYANGGCMNMFTQGQKTRVNNYFSSPTGRAYVISAATHLATGINTNPSCGPIADFWYGQDEIEICAGQSMTFDGLSYNGEITSRTWTFEGGTPATSSDEDPVITYNTPGVYKVELEVGNGTGSDKLTRNLFVRVLPSVSEFKAPYGVDFSDGSDDWNLQVGEDGTGWKQNNVRGFSGSKCLEMDIDASSLGSTTYTAIMPPVDMTTQANAKLHFKHAYARRTSSGSAEVLIVRVSSDCQKTWSTLKGYSAVLLATEDASPNWVPTSKAHWAKKEIDLSNYNDAESLYIRFDVLCNSGNSVFLDDINVGQHPLSVPSYVRDFNVWLQPNPAQNKLEVKVTQNINDATISIVDITGRLLLQQNLDGTSLEVNTSELAKGVYTVILVSEGVKWSKKLIISK